MSQDLQGRRGAIDDGGFHANVARAAVENEVNVGPEIIDDVLSRRRTHPTEPVRRRCSHRSAEQFENAQSGNVGRNAHSNRVPTSRCQAGHIGPSTSEEGQWSRPKSGTQTRNDIGGFGDDELRRGDGINVNDEWMRARTILDVEDSPDGSVIRGVCRESVNGFRWQTDETTAAQNVDGSSDARLIGGDDHGCH